MRSRVHLSWVDAINRLVAAGAVAASLLLLAGAPASADAPTQVGPVAETFEDVNPCTGLVQTGMLVVTFYAHSEDGRIVARGDRLGARSVVVVGLSTGTARVDSFDLTCLGS